MKEEKLMNVMRAQEKMLSSKKALSNVVASVIMILIVVTSIILVGTFITNLVNERVEESQSCLNTMENVLIKNSQTCYNVSSKVLTLFIEIKDIEIEEVLVSVADANQAKTISITNTPKHFNYMKDYNGESELALPGKKSGLAYYIDLSNEELKLEQPKEIKISPTINKNSCGVSDTMTLIPSC